MTIIDSIQLKLYNLHIYTKQGINIFGGDVLGCSFT